MKSYGFIIATLIIITSCTSKNNLNNNEKPHFSHIQTNFKLTNKNNYPCDTISLSDIQHIVNNGQLVNEREIHDHYAITGCSIDGTLLVNKELYEFTLDYGGIVYINNGMTLACGEACCHSGFTYCSFDQEKENID